MSVAGFRSPLIWLWSIVVLGLSVAGCGGGGGDNSTSSVAPPSALSYSNPQTYTVGIAVATLTPNVTGTVTGYSISPALPDGLAFNTTNGQISGTPTVSATSTAYTITASNGSGSTTFSLSLVVNLSSPAVTVGYGIKQVTLSWSAVSGATYYRVLKSPTASASHAELAGNLTTTSYSDAVAAHLTDWINVSYIVAACDSKSCTDSAPINGLDGKQVMGYFKASNTGPNDSFGHSVAISSDGTTMAVGALGESSSATGINGSQDDNSIQNAGAVYVFVRNGNAWSQQAYIKASNTEAGDNFGLAVALSADGTTLAVSANAERSGATGIDGPQGDNSKFNSGAVYVFTRTGTTWSQQAYVKASNTDASDLFGESLALSADGATLAVGAPEEDSSAVGINGAQADNSKFDAGAVYVYTRNGTVWSQQAYVKASNTNNYYYFGSAVALSANGSVLAVGSSGEASSSPGIDGPQGDNSKYYSGASYVFTRSGSIWSQQSYIKASNPDSSDAFGGTIALNADGTTLAVGATGEDSNARGINGTQSDNSAMNAGALYVFTRTGSAWSQQAYIKASNADASDTLGVSVSLSADGNTVAAGAHGEQSSATGPNGVQTDNSKPFAGAVYVLTRNGSTWSQRAYLKALRTNTSERLGRSISLSGDGATLATGATGETSSAIGIGGVSQGYSVTSAGAVWVY